MEPHQPIDYKIISTAYHEATHALFALLSFFKIDKVEIYSKEKKKAKLATCGITSFFSPLQYSNSQFLRNKFAISELIINYSGVVGEEILFKQISGLKKAPGHIKKSGFFDNKSSKEIFRQYLAGQGIKLTQFKSNSYRKIESILKNYWDDVKIISTILLKKRKLTHTDIKNELTRKSKNKQFWKQRFKVINCIFIDSFIVLDDSALRDILLFQEKLW